MDRIRATAWTEARKRTATRAHVPDGPWAYGWVREPAAGRFSGLLGALVWKGVYLYELGYNLIRARVLADWAIDLFARPDTSKFMED